MKRLTKSQYEVMARVIKRHYEGQQSSDAAHNQGLRMGAFHIAHDLGMTFAQYDTEFDLTKFLALCGITD